MLRNGTELRSFKDFMAETYNSGGVDPKREKAVRIFASATHEAWRTTLPTAERNQPRIRSKNGGPKQDINVPFDKLHPTAQAENIAAGHAAHKAVKRFGGNDDKAGEHIHNAWMKRNPPDDYNKHLHIPYEELPENEKEKDRVQAKQMRTILRSNK